uniref:Uncharacterized protein n=1 Tax=Spironucleus salmonicida TaxID=348837 RepID=V6M7E2_9EUKA|eukprot:EST49359.1 Hypothetical protein SS50377_10284 [Spironucleus salmonicida]
MGIIEQLDIIIEQLTDTSNISSQELSKLLNELQLIQKRSQQQNIELSEEIIIQKLLAKSVQQSSVIVIQKLLKQMRSQKLFKIDKLFNKIRDQNQNIIIHQISDSGIKIIGQNFISLAPDLLNDQFFVKKQIKNKNIELEYQQRQTTAPAQFKASQWEQERKQSILKYLQQINGSGYIRALLSKNITETALNIFNTSQLIAEGHIFIQNISKDDALQIDQQLFHSNQPFEETRIFVGQVDQQILKETKGQVFSISVNNEQFRYWKTQYENITEFTF